MFSVFDTFAVTSSVNSGYGRPEVVCHLLSSCEHASTTSKSDFKVLEFSNKFEMCRRTWRWESQSYPCWRRPWLLFCQCSAWALWKVHSHRIYSVGVDLQPWKQLIALDTLCSCRKFFPILEKDASLTDQESCWVRCVTLELQFLERSTNRNIRVYRESHQ